jgi:hypothetical protein
MGGMQRRVSKVAVVPLLVPDHITGPNQAPSRRVYKKDTAQHSSSRRSARALHQAVTPVVGQVPSALAPSNTMIKV